MAKRSRPAACCTAVAIKPLAARKSAELAALAKALADPNRIEILRLLAGQEGPLCACDIVGHVDLSQPTVSHHLKVLREAGLLKSGKSGLWSFYSIDPSATEALEALVGLVEK